MRIAFLASVAFLGAVAWSHVAVAAPVVSELGVVSAGDGVRVSWRTGVEPLSTDSWVEVNTASDGSASGSWVKVSAAPTSPGVQTVLFDAGALFADGAHGVRLVARRAALTECDTGRAAQATVSREAGAFLAVVCPVKSTTITLTVRGGNRVNAELGVSCPEWACGSVQDVTDSVVESGHGVGRAAWNIGSGAAVQAYHGAKFVATHTPWETGSAIAHAMVHGCDDVYQAGGGRWDCAFAMTKKLSGYDTAKDIGVCIGNAAAGKQVELSECLTYAVVLVVPLARGAQAGSGKVLARTGRSKVFKEPIPNRCLSRTPPDGPHPFPRTPREPRTTRRRRTRPHRPRTRLPRHPHRNHPPHQQMRRVMSAHSCSPADEHPTTKTTCGLTGQLRDSGNRTPGAGKQSH